MQSSEPVHESRTERFSQTITLLERGWNKMKQGIDWYGRKVHDLTFNEHIPESVSIVAEAALKALPLLAIFTFAPTWVSVIAGLTVAIYTLVTDETPRTSPERRLPCPSLVNAIAIKTFWAGCRQLVGGEILGGLGLIAFGVGFAFLDGAVLNKLKKSFFREAAQESAVEMQPMGESATREEVPAAPPASVTEGEAVAAMSV